MKTRFNPLTRPLWAAVCAGWLLLIPSPSAAVTTTFSNISLGAGLDNTQVILNSGLFAANDEFEVNAVLTFTPSSTTSYDLLFVVTDGSGSNPLFGGQVEYVGPGTRIRPASGNTAGTAAGTDNAIFNGTVSFPIAIEFIVDGVGGAGSETMITKIQGVEQSLNSSGSGLSPLDPSTGLQVQLFNRGDVGITIDSLVIEVIPEPGVGVLLLLSSGLVMFRRRGV